MSALRPPVARIDALDMTKGLLVVCMVVYHSLNYTTQYYLAFRFMAFLPPSFILITGFLLSHIYLARHDPADPQLRRRLFGRGAKLLALFTALNLLSLAARSQHYHGPAGGLGTFLQYAPEIYLTGAGGQAVFEILLPIAYLLLLAPGLLWLDRIHPAVLPLLAVATLGACQALELRGTYLPNLSLLSAGLLGMQLGRIGTATLARTSRIWPFAAAAYAAHAWLGATVGQNFLHQMTGATLALVVFFGASAAAGSAGWWAHRLIQLGRFSLIAYIGQIALLQVYSHMAGRPTPFSATFWMMLSGTLLLTAFGVEVVRWACAGSIHVNRIYRAVMP